MINCSPRIPPLLLMGWVPGNGGFSSHHCSASAHSTVGSTGSPSTGLGVQVQHQSCLTPATPVLSSLQSQKISSVNFSEVLADSSQVYLIIIWFVSIFSENSASYKGLRPDIHKQQPQVPENGQQLKVNNFYSSSTTQYLLPLSMGLHYRIQH